MIDRISAKRNPMRLGTVFAETDYKVRTPLPANDNGLDAANDDALLLEFALRHFAENGLCAARRASDEALSAHAAGDGDGFDWWLSVCRMLDRRMADAVAAKAALAT